MILPEPIIIIMIALFGYFLFYLLHMPTPALLGPFAMIILVSILGTNLDPMSDEIMVLLQILLGINIGCKVSRKIFQQMRELLLPSVLMIVWTLILTFGMGWVLIEVFQIDVATALLSTAPAGIAEMGILAVSLNASVGIVSLFQLSRLMVTLIVFPIIISKLQQNKKEAKETTTALKGFQMRIRGIAAGMNRFAEAKIEPSGILAHLSSFGIGLIGGVAGHISQIPAGPMMGSFFLVAAFSVAGKPLRTPPSFVRTFMMLGIGIMIALNAVQTPVRSIQSILLPMIGFSAIMYLSAYGMYRILRRITSWDMVCCILASAPGGITPMALLADEHSENSTEVVLLHMVRLLTVKVFIIPAIISVLL
ncbi:MAG: hypothetical protein D5S00_10255 [Tindallia sp. MSAO_Bac2]|nr:MAG: hypothetical protein D5S00_10255 [Tindallia sp. MSAO_Bac2]